MTTEPVRIAVAGCGAFGRKHLDALQRIDTARVAAVVDPDVGKAQAAAQRVGGGAAVHAALADVLADPAVDAVVLATPTPQHAAQGVACLEAGKHVLVEIPVADGWDGVAAVDAAQRASGLVAMGGHVRRFNPGHVWLHDRIRAGNWRLQHLAVQTFFWRRTNVNLQGELRGWTDHLLWHHAAHTVDLFLWQTGEPIVRAQALQGPPHPELGIAMDLSVQLQSAGGALCSLALSFNCDGPQGSVFRYIGDAGTFVARNDDLHDGHGAAVDLAAAVGHADGVERQDRAFVAAIAGRREPEAAVGRLLPAYSVLRDLERQLGAGR